MRGDEKYGTKKFQAMCLIMSSDSEQYSGIWNDLKNSTFWGTNKYPKTTTSAYDILCCYKKTTPKRQVHISPVAVLFVQSSDKRKTRQYQETMGDNLKKSHASADRKHDSMQENSQHQHPKLALDQNHYRWESPLTKPQSMHQPPPLLIQIGSF